MCIAAGASYPAGTDPPRLTAAAPSEPPVADPRLRLAADEVLPSIVEVLQDAHGTVHDQRDDSDHGPYDVSFSGTGFFASADGYLVTAAHVAEPTAAELKDELVNSYIDDLYTCDSGSAADQCRGVEVAHHDEVAARTAVRDSTVSLHVLLQSMNPNADGLAATVVASSQSPQLDVAVLKVSVHNEPVALVNTRLPMTGDRLLVLGYPASADNGPDGPTLVPTVTVGSVTGLLDPDPSSEIAANARLVEADVSAEEGTSGGPGVTADGSVLGVVSFGTSSIDNFLVSAADVASVLRGTPARNVLGAVDTSWRDGLTAERRHQFARAAQLFDRCVQLNSDDLQCRDHARAARASMGSATGVTSSATALLVVIAGLGAAVLVVATAVAVLVLRRRRQLAQTSSTSPATPPPPPPLPS